MLLISVSLSSRLPLVPPQGPSPLGRSGGSLSAISPSQLLGRLETRQAQNIGNGMFQHNPH